MSPRSRQRLVRNAISRRQFLGRAGLVTGAVVLTPSLLAACGGDDDDSASGGGGGDNSIKISNWTGYMDENQDLVKQFNADTGINATYVEDINDNEEYFTKIRPNLSDGKGTGSDGMVLTDWMASRLINQVDPPWVMPFVAASFPNKSNLIPELATPAFDADRTYSAPWASGVTGIAYNIQTTGKEINTIDDFLSAPGTKTVLTEMRDTVGLFMLANGADPANPTFDAAAPAFDAIEKAVNDGQIDGFNGNEYVNDLGAGNLSAAFSWSGDVAQITLDNPDIRFAVPQSGGMLWSDNFLIPLGAKDDLATQWINYWYDPVHAAELTAAIQFISPVAGVPDELTKMGGDAAALVDNPLVVPTDEMLTQLSIFGTLDEDQETQFVERFSEILGAG